MIREISVENCPLTPKYRTIFLKQINEDMRKQGIELSEYEMDLMMQAFNQGLDLGATMAMEVLHIELPED